MDLSRLAENDPGGQGISHVELDSHADTCVAGANCVMFEDTGQRVRVSAYNEVYDPVEDVPIGTALTAWTSPEIGETFIFVLNQALIFGDSLKHTLLCPNQLRAHGLQVSDVPKQFDKNSSHSIFIPEHDLRIPLGLRGVISRFETHKPTRQEIENCAWIELTGPDEWDPHSPTFAEREERNVSGTLKSVDKYDDVTSREIFAVSVANDDNGLLGKRLMACVNVAVRDIAGDGLEGREDEEFYEDGIDVCNLDREISAIGTSGQKPIITKEILSRRWGIGLDQAHKTLQVTTQRGVRKVLHPLERRYRTRQTHLRYPTVNRKFYSDTMFATTKSVRGNKCAQVFTDGAGWDVVYPMAKKSEAPEALSKLIHEFSMVPKHIITDDAPEQTGGRWKELVDMHRIRQTWTEPYSPWQNRAERAIREIKKAMKRHASRSGSPRRLWCFLAEWVANIRRLTAHDIPDLNGRVPSEAYSGDTPDISEYAQFDWYQYVWYIDSDGARKLGRWIGVATNYGAPMTFWVLPRSCKPIVRSSVQAILKEELDHVGTMVAMLELDADVLHKIGDARSDQEVVAAIGDLLPIMMDEADDDLEDTIEPAEPESTRPEADDQDYVVLDKYLSAEVLLDRGGQGLRGRVIARKRDAEGRPIGMANNNPILDSREYEVQFEDGGVEAYTANTIAECMYAQVDEEGKEFLLLKEIIDHRSDGSAVRLDDGFLITKQGRRMPRRTTKGWKLLVTWKDGTTTWVPLKDLRESHPVQVAEYAVANKIAEEPAFAWWIRDVLRRRDRIIKKVKSRYWKRTHKFGIRMPKSVAEALMIDKETGTDFWRKAIEKEMRNVMPAFEFRDDDKMPIGFKKIDCHMIFDIKMDLTRKARFVAGGHQTDPPKESVYSSVVSRDSVRIAFLIAALNDLEVLSADIQNAYLNAHTKERVYTIAGPEFGKDQGRPVLIVRALYGLKSSGARFRDHVAHTLREGGFVSSQGDPDVWMRPATKKDGFEYWEYVLCYVDDILVFSEKPKAVMDYLASRYTLKEGSVKEPDQYLGAQISKFRIDGAEDPDKTRWAMSSDLYIKRAIKDVETELETSGSGGLKTKVTTPCVQGYRPEIDVSPELSPKAANYFQGLIGILRWCVELGRIDILLEVSLLSRFLAAPREGHLEQCYHIFAYLKKHDRSKIVFDDTLPNFDAERFTECDWAEYYPDAQEAISPNAPKARGNAVLTSGFVDADHAGCRVTRRSHTGVLLFVNRAPIIWFSKRQNTVESSTFGSEFIAMRTAIDLIEALRYKLRMFGIPIDGSTKLFCDNESVVRNTTAPESTLKKKHTAICYHRAREAQAGKWVQVAKEDGETNLADLLTKPLPGPRHKMLVQRILW